MLRPARESSPSTGSTGRHERLECHDRLEWLVADGGQTQASFADAVRDGLAGESKSLPCRFFYDELGSQLFDEICDLEEYYPTRAERRILEERANELADLFDAPAELVELGSGSADKTRLVIEAFLRTRGALTFVPVDISRSALENSAASLLETYPDLHIQAVEGEYERGLERIHEGSDDPRLILWLGSSIGNLERPAAAAFLGRVRAAMTRSERLLVGIDLRKDSGVLERAYDDTEGVTARFNLNLLTRINREIGGNFDLDRFRHRAVYREDEGRVEMHIESQGRQSVHIADLELDVELDDRERIHTESSYKYSFHEIDELAETAGLRLEERWLDPEGLFSLNLFARG